MPVTPGRSDSESAQVRLLAGILILARLPAGSAGARFVLSPKHRLNLALDVGVGKLGAEFYFSIGEAF